MNRHILILIIIVVSAILPSVSVNAAVKVAMIADKAFDLRKSPLVSLLEVRLSQEDGIELLERAEIDKILAEHELAIKLIEKIAQEIKKEK